MEPWCSQWAAVLEGALIPSPVPVTTGLESPLHHVKQDKSPDKHSLGPSLLKFTAEICLGSDLNIRPREAEVCTGVCHLWGAPWAPLLGQGRSHIVSYVPQNNPLGEALHPPFTGEQTEAYKCN